MTSTRWLDDEEQRAWRTYLFASSLLHEHFSQVLEQTPDIDLSLPEYEILVRLSEAEGRHLRMSELAEQIVHSRSRLTHTVARLERRGYVERIRCANDGRGREAHLTDVGYAALEYAAPHHVASVIEHFIDVVGRDDFLQLGRIMHKVLVAHDED
ncbi:MarR family winged helix-turn-helix transcriptional regulator [Devriesea agamarum]|uniref:MarR family winged helix-turn-helix transcriptional regulator n=1 Tax=Devriesea agamarum TaxID=472569 RepID=UPI00071C957A|nr:MarR family transcriptional regulator [Devriesea agamarum]